MCIVLQHLYLIIVSLIIIEKSGINIFFTTTEDIIFVNHFSLKKTLNNGDNSC